MNPIVRKYLLSNVARIADVGGAPGGAPAGGAPGGGTPAGGAPGGGAPGGGTPGGGAPGGGDKPFYADLVKDPDNIKFIADRKFDSFDTILKSGRSADELARSRNVLPKPDPTKINDWEGWEALGWNKDRAKYAPKEPARKDGQQFDAGMFKDFTDLAHENRVPVGAVEKIYQGMFDKIQARVAEQDGQAATAQKAATEKLEAALKAKWPGEAFAQNSDLSRRAWRALGVPEGLSGKLEQIMGSPELVEFGHKLGTLLGEDTIGELGGKTGGESAEQLEAEIRKMHGDQSIVAVLNDPRHPQHQDMDNKRQTMIDKLAKLKRQAA